MFVSDYALAQDERIKHGFFGRAGGVSTGIYSSLNCGIGSGDAPEAVAENRRRVAGALGGADLVTLHQVHSADCIYVREPFALEDRPQADAMVTDVPGLVIGVLTADCGPVLFRGQAEDGRPVIGAAHAGWGGAVRGVLEATVQAMVERGALPESLCAAIGPCIGPESYEVSDEFKTPFITQDAENEAFFRAGARDGHLMFDLPGYIARRLRRAGVGTVQSCGIDTYFNEEDYFSYRRATHRSEPDYGRQVAAIVISGP